jgi:hypothetical protein
LGTNTWPLVLVESLPKVALTVTNSQTAPLALFTGTSFQNMGCGDRHLGR